MILKPLFLKRNGRKRRKIIVALTVLVAVFLGGVILYERLFEGKIESPATNLAVTTIERMIAEAAAEVKGIGIEGGVSERAAVEPGKLNEKRETFDDALAERMRENRTLKVKIPLGTLLGGRFLSGKGPSLSSRVFCDYKTEYEITTDLVSVGINQTMYTAAMTVTVDCTLYFDTGPRTVSVKDRVILDQMMFIGGTPLG